VRPRDPIELLVAGVWAALLERPWVGVREALPPSRGAREQALARLAAVTGLQPPPPSLASADTVEACAAALRRAVPALRQRARAFFARNVAMPPGEGRPCVFFFHGDQQGGLPWFPVAAHLGADQPFYGMAPPGACGEAIPDTLEGIASSYLARIREIQPAGPYLLGGHCNGAVAAFEVARMLLAQGERVLGALLIGPMLPRTYRRGPAGVLNAVVVPALDVAWTAARELGWRARAGWRGRAPGQPASAPVDARRAAIGRWNDPVFDRYSRILQGYRPGPLAAPATIIWPHGEPRRFRVPSELAWRRVVPRARVMEVPGTHLGCYLDHGGALGRAMRLALDEVLSGAVPAAGAATAP